MTQLSKEDFHTPVFPNPAGERPKPTPSPRSRPAGERIADALWVIEDHIGSLIELRSADEAAMEGVKAAYLAAAQAVADARVAFSEAFLLYKAKAGASDGQAREQATIATKSGLDVALARLELARRALDKHSTTSERGHAWIREQDANSPR